jgi:hypothetical protein
MTSLSSITVPRGLYEIQIASTASTNSSDGAIITFYLKISERITFNFESRAGGTSGCNGSAGRNSYYITIPFSDQCIFYRSATEARAKTKLYRDGTFRIGVGGMGGSGGGNWETSGGSMLTGGGGGGGAGIDGTGGNGSDGTGGCSFMGGGDYNGGKAGSGGSGQLIYDLNNNLVCVYGAGGGGGGGSSAGWYSTPGSPGSIGSSGENRTYIGAGQGGSGGGGNTQYGGSNGGGITGNYSGSFKFTGRKLKRI